MRVQQGYNTKSTLHTVLVYAFQQLGFRFLEVKYSLASIHKLKSLEPIKVSFFGPLFQLLLNPNLALCDVGCIGVQFRRKGEMKIWLAPLFSVNTQNHWRHYARIFFTILVNKSSKCGGCHSCVVVRES